MNRVYLTNLEYDYLFRIGGDGLVAFFATLRNSKISEVIKKSGKKKTLRLIQDATGMSRTIVEKHLPLLLEAGLVEIHKNGNVAVHSRKWSDKYLPKLGKRKLIPITVYESFIDTKLYSAFVRIHSRILKQERQIGKKAKRIEVMEACSNDERLSKGDYRIWKKLYRQGITLEELKSKFRSKSTLSNLAFHKILKDSNIPSDCNESCGRDFKSKLINLGLIEQNRIFELVLPGVNNNEYVLRENELSGYGGLFQGSLGIYHEISPEIILSNALVGAEKKQVEK